MIDVERTIRIILRWKAVILPQQFDVNTVHCSCRFLRIQ